MVPFGLRSVLPFVTIVDFEKQLIFSDTGRRTPKTKLPQKQHAYLEHNINYKYILNFSKYIFYWCISIIKSRKKLQI